MENYSAIGKRLPRVDGVAKATGRPLYAGDVILPRMLCGGILRSPYPHAKILDIDTTRAVRLPGVKAVLTGKETAGKKYGVVPYIPSIYDDLILQREKARYVGDAVACVAAVDEDAVLEALDLIRVEYEPLPAVFDPEEAYKPGAPQIHSHVERNLCFPMMLVHGDMEVGFKASDHIREDRFEVAKKQHCFIENYSSLASYDAASRGLTVWTSTQNPFLVREYLSHMLDWPQSRVNLMNTHIGGSFGGKGGLTADLFCSAILSIKTERPVRIIYTREESFLCGIQKHPMVFYLKVGVKKDGTIQAVDATVFNNTGAYAGYGPTITLVTCGFLSLTYRIPNYRFDGKTMYTNIPSGGPHRGFGNQQSRFAFEQALDVLAEDLGMDPIEIRIKNAIQKGDITPDGWKITSCGLVECLEGVRDRSGWKEKRGKLGKGHGVGVGCTGYIVGGRVFYNYDCAGAFVKVEDDAKVSLIVSSGDSGQGIETTLSQIAAEELGVSMEDVRILLSDTDTAPRNMGAYASRTTLILGNACKLALEEAKKQLFDIVAEKLEVHHDDLEAKDGRIYVKGSPEKGLTFKEAVSIAKNEKGLHIIGRGYYDPPSEFPVYKEGKGNIAPTYSFGAGVAEVKVDTDTGKVNFLKETQAQDVGRAINPMQCEGQMEGAVVGAMGQLLYEELVFEEGKALNPSFLDYKVPTAMDIPETEVILVETIDPEGPFGAKGMSESPEIPPIGAVANALYDAVGIRVRSLPITPEKVLRALKKEK